MNDIVEQAVIIKVKALAEMKHVTQLHETTNDIFIPYYDNKSRYLVMKGGAGSGKSIFAGRKVLERITREPKHRILICRKVAKTLKDSCFAQIRGQISQHYESSEFVINKSDFHITHKPTGNEIIFAGLDDVEKMKSIFGVTSIWIEEASELEEGDFLQLDLRLRGSTRHYKQIMLTFNPVSITHWLKNKFFDEEMPHRSATTVHSTYKNNRFIDAAYKKQLEDLKEKDFYHYTVYCLGEWGVIGKQVFDSEKLVTRLIIIKNLKYEQGMFEEFDGKIIFKEDANGFWRIHRKPKPTEQFVIGADPAEGLEHGDYSSAIVLNNSNLQQAATFREHVDPDKFAEELQLCGLYFNKALIAPETNMETGVIRNLERMNYPKLYMREDQEGLAHKIEKKFGWKTGKTSRRMMISDTIEYVREHVEGIMCTLVIEEMLSFVRDAKGKPQAQPGKHDDLVIAYAIAIQAALSGQQSKGTFQKTVDIKKLFKLPQDYVDDYYRATEAEKKRLADRWNLWTSELV